MHGSKNVTHFTLSLVLAAPSLPTAPATAAFAPPSLAAGTPFVSRICTPNLTHTPTHPRPPPFSKCPWDQGRFVVLVCLKTGHPSCVCVCVTVAVGGG